jgi:hypothetical protein
MVRKREIGAIAQKRGFGMAPLKPATGFSNGSLPPIGYRIVEAAEQRGHAIS